MRAALKRRFWASIVDNRGKEYYGNLALGDHLKSGQRLSLQNRSTEVAGPGLVCSTLPLPVKASLKLSGSGRSVTHGRNFGVGRFVLISGRNGYLGLGLVRS